MGVVVKSMGPGAIHSLTSHMILSKLLDVFLFHCAHLKMELIVIMYIKHSGKIL